MQKIIIIYNDTARDQHGASDFSIEDVITYVNSRAHYIAVMAYPKDVPPGESYGKFLKRHINNSLVVVVMGRGWQTEFHDKDTPFGKAVRMALKSNTVVMPVLLPGADDLEQVELPRRLRSLHGTHVLRFHTERDLEPIISRAQMERQSPRTRFSFGTGNLLTTLVVVIGVLAGLSEFSGVTLRDAYQLITQGEILGTPTMEISTTEENTPDLDTDVPDRATDTPIPDPQAPAPTKAPVITSELPTPSTRQVRIDDAQSPYLIDRIPRPQETIEDARAACADEDMIVQSESQWERAQAAEPNRFTIVQGIEEWTSTPADTSAGQPPTLTVVVDETSAERRFVAEDEGERIAFRCVYETPS